VRLYFQVIVPAAHALGESVLAVAPDAEGSRRARYGWVKNALECSEREGVDLPIYMNQAHSHDATNSS
jgi:hypothetical protein